MVRVVSPVLLAFVLGAKGEITDVTKNIEEAHIIEHTMNEALDGSCKYPSSKVGSIHGTCFHIYQGGAGSGLAEKNCGDIAGDIGFVFPRGFNAYYNDGYIAYVHWGVTKWGRYGHCNHAPGSSQYHCDGGTNLAGKERAHTATGQGTWYSFPAAGRDKTWSSVGALHKGAECGVLRIKAKCLFSLVGKASGHCPQGCEGKSANDCAHCIAGVSTSKEAEIWNDAFFHGKCPLIHDTEDEQADLTYEATATELPAWDRNVTWGFWRYPPFAKEPASAEVIV